MNIVSDFYSKPSRLSAFTTYERRTLHQRGGARITETAEGRRKLRSGARHFMAAILGLGRGIINYRIAAQTAKDMAKANAK